MNQDLRTGFEHHLYLGCLFNGRGDALKALALVDARKCQVVKLRYFGGFSVEETAEVLKVSPDTVLRHWRLAKAWLHREMSQEKSDEA